MLRVDDLPPTAIPAGVAPHNNKLRIVAWVELETLRAARDAKNRIAVAIQIDGRTFHERQFGVTGLSAAIVEFFKKCGMAE